MELDRAYIEERTILLKERFWIGTHRDNGKEGGLKRRGGDRSTTRHKEKRWGEVKLLARNRIRWRHFVDALCP